jgi:predicted DNA-binding protein
VPSKRVTITLPEELALRVQELADDAKLAMASYVSRVVEHHVLNQNGLTAMEYWESAHGPLSRPEIVSADEAIAAARARLRPPTS